MNCTSMLPRHPQLPNIVISDGTLEGLKWLGLVLMTGDHLNKYLFNGTLPYLFELGRIAMPIFTIVLALNLAREMERPSDLYKRTMIRLVFFGSIATFPFVSLGGLYSGFWPLNILFTLTAMTATVFFIERKQHITAFLVFLLTGAVVEFWWPALLLGVSVWAYARYPAWPFATIAALACASLSIVNENLWAMAVFPIFFAATHYQLPIPRIRWLFYTYYPLHLCVICIIRIPMRKAGYLFF